MQKVIDNGSAARKAAHFICFPSFVAGDWKAMAHALNVSFLRTNDMNGYESMVTLLVMHFFSFIPAFLCPESLFRWMLRNTKRSFENGPRSLKKLELKLIQISADSPAQFDTSTQALTNSNQQSLNLNLSKFHYIIRPLLQICLSLSYQSFRVSVNPMRNLQSPGQG